MFTQNYDCKLIDCLYKLTPPSEEARKERDKKVQECKRKNSHVEFLADNRVRATIR